MEQWSNGAMEWWSNGERTPIDRMAKKSSVAPKHNINLFSRMQI